MERAMGFEPTTFCLGSKHSTTELRPHLLFRHYTNSWGQFGSGLFGAQFALWFRSGLTLLEGLAATCMPLPSVFD